jgi:hypothetical protein
MKFDYIAIIYLAAIGLHFYPIWEAASVDEWLYSSSRKKETEEERSQ